MSYRSNSFAREDHPLFDQASRMPEGTSRVRCVYCSETRTRKNQSQRTLTVTVEHDRALYNCHHCGESGVLSLTSSWENKRPSVQIQQRSTFGVVNGQRHLSDPHVEWLLSRGISRQTAEKAGLFSKEVYLRGSGESDVVGFPYQGAVKFRCPVTKGFSCSGAPQHYFLQDFVRPEDGAIIITEGEIDALSILECGMPNAVSVPNGAPVNVSEGKIKPSEDNKFRYVWGAEKLYKECKKVIIATDNDEPGNALAEELARRIGKYRCYRVKFPASMKDANEVLTSLGSAALKEIVENASPWPVAGLYETGHYMQKVVDLYHKGEAKGFSTGLPRLDTHYTVAPGQFTVVTGIPSSGKSEFVDHLMVELAQKEGWSFAVCSFENPPEAHIVKLVEKKACINFYNQEGETRLSEEDMKDAVNWVSSHFYWMENADGAASSIDGIIERAKVAVMRYGVRGVVIDPYNFIDRPSNMPETEFVSDTLTKIKQFAMGHDVHVWFVAHPMKLKRSEDGSYPAPMGYEISGSAAWFAKADCGLTVHRSSMEGLTEIHMWKVRFKWIGKTGCVSLAYDRRTGRYSDGKEEDGKIELPELIDDLGKEAKERWEACV